MTFALKISFILTAVVALVYIHKNYIYRLWTQQKAGVVIILNGPSAAGKSTLQKTIQRFAPVPYLGVGVDAFFNDLFPDEHGKLRCKTVANFEQTLRYVTIENNTVYLHVGAEGRKIVTGMNQAIAAYARAGNNLVVDYIMYDPSWMQELLQALEGCPVYMIGITLPLEILQQREQARSTSPLGHAKSHYDTVHINNAYDMMLDTSILSADQAAEQILNFIEKTPR